MDLGNEAAVLGNDAAVPSTTMPDDDAPVKRRGRPPGSRNAGASGKKVREAQNKTIAEMANASFFSATELLLGEEAKPTPDEAKELDTQLFAYLQSKPDFDLPPGFVLFGAYAMYFGHKLKQQQSARERAKRIATRTAKGIGGLFRRGFSKLKRKDKDNASVHG